MGSAMSSKKLGSMDGKARQKLFKRQTTEQYAEIGRFVVEFERAGSMLRFGILAALHRDGQRSQRLGQILTDNKFMTAAPLIEAYEAIMTEIGARKDPIQKEVLDQVSSEFRNLMEERNRLVHGNWAIGYASSDDVDFSKMGGLKGKPSKKKGMDFEQLPIDVKEISELADRSESLRHFLMAIDAVLHFQTVHHGKGKFENNFTKEGDKWSYKQPAKNAD